MEELHKKKEMVKTFIGVLDKDPKTAISIFAGVLQVFCKQKRKKNLIFQDKQNWGFFFTLSPSETEKLTSFYRGLK